MLLLLVNSFVISVMLLLPVSSLVISVMLLLPVTSMVISVMLLLSVTSLVISVILLLQVTSLGPVHYHGSQPELIVRPEGCDWPVRKTKPCMRPRYRSYKTTLAGIIHQ